MSSFHKTCQGAVSTFQGRNVKNRIIKQKEQRNERHKRQKHKTALGGTFREY